MENFIEKFAEAVDVDNECLTLKTEFRKLDEWDSLAYLSVIAMIDEEYNCQIESVVFKQLNTLNDIAEYIDNHK